MKKKKIIEKFYIQKGKSFFTGNYSEFGKLPTFTYIIEKAHAFDSVWKAMEIMKLWSRGQTLHCSIYVRRIEE